MDKIIFLNLKKKDISIIDINSPIFAKLSLNIMPSDISSRCFDFFTNKSKIASITIWVVEKTLAPVNNVGLIHEKYATFMEVLFYGNKNNNIATMQNILV